MTDSQRTLHYDIVCINFPGTESFEEKIRKLGLSYPDRFSIEFGDYVISVDLCYNGGEGQPFGRPNRLEGSQAATNEDFTRIIGLVVSDLQGTRTLLKDVEQLVQEGIHKEELSYHRKPIPYSDLSTSRFVIFDQSTQNDIFQKVYDAYQTKEEWVPDEIKTLRKLGRNIVKLDGYLPYVYGDEKVQSALEKAVELYKQVHLLGSIKKD